MEIINKRLNVEPNAGDVFGESWNLMWKTFIGLLAVTIIYMIISGPTGMFQYKVDSHTFYWFLVPLAMFAIAFGIFIAGPIKYSTSWVFLKAVRGEHYEVGDMFAVFKRNYWNAVAGNVVVALIVGIGLLMILVPGIIFAIRLSFVPYLIIDREMELTEAMNKSWEMTKGYGGQIFLMGILSILVVILGLLALFFGVIISAVWIHTAFAMMYQAVVEKEGHFGYAIEEV